MDILVVDDDPDVLDLLKTYLESENHSVTLADRAQAALQRLEEKTPRLVLLDARMPDGDGIEVLKTIKRKASGVSVVVMTGFKDAELVVEAFRQGAMDCILKPFNFEYLKLHILSRLGPS